MNKCLKEKIIFIPKAKTKRQSLLKSWSISCVCVCTCVYVLMTSHYIYFYILYIYILYIFIYIYIFLCCMTSHNINFESFLFHLKIHHTH